MKMKNQFFRDPIVLSFLALLFATSSAKAACGSPYQPSGVTAPVLFVGQSADEDSAQSTERQHGHDNSILGLWHVAYTLSDGTIAFQSFKLWHSDGTEWESANLSPFLGNVCIGVWKETKGGNVRLHHVAWIFASGVLTGTATMDEINTVASAGTTYTGTFTLMYYDLNGNKFQHLKGTQTAKHNTDKTTKTP